ncbi:hypothetical protein, partial [Halomonas piscis]|uniref:hypothetical protein n=1 Tax=Halomonas piscis TaxID=3031727 RepID=UPI0028A25DF5
LLCQINANRRMLVHDSSPSFGGLNAILPDEASEWGGVPFIERSEAISGFPATRRLKPRSLRWRSR